MYYGRGEYAPARQALEAAVALDSQDMAALVTLGLVYDALGEPGPADAVFARAVRAVDDHPEQTSARLAVADALAKSPRWRSAEAHYRRLLAGPPPPHALLAAKAHLGLGFLVERAGDAGAAFASYQEAIRLDPGLMDARFNAANLLLRGGRSAEATAAYERILKDDPRFFLARFNLGRLYEQAGRSDDARAQYRAFLDLAPPSPAYAAARAHAAATLGAGAEGPRP
ncbi:MAG: tetratricopeptide repeat protein [Nitrospirae bacterium]|nr:tetratricopeptide repeat protein [Nitrospirota bacterium]